MPSKCRRAAVRGCPGLGLARWSTKGIIIKKGRRRRKKELRTGIEPQHQTDWACLDESRTEVLLDTRPMITQISVMSIQRTARLPKKKRGSPPPQHHIIYFKKKKKRKRKKKKKGLLRPAFTLFPAVNLLRAWVSP
jgi:hypothetical protein